MADSYYQIATTPKLYISYPLWLYATVGSSDLYSVLGLPEQSDSIITEEDHIRTIQLDPSNWKQYNFNIANSQNPIADEMAGSYNYPITPQLNTPTTTVNVENIWNFDYIMFLGHNWNTMNYYPKVQAWNGDILNNYISDVEMSNIVNYNYGAPPENDGWTLCSLDTAYCDSSQNVLRCTLTPELDENEDVINTSGNPILGSLAFGKTYTFPQNCRINTKTTMRYGINQKQTYSGKTISNADYVKPNSWITEPFGLGDSQSDIYKRRSGLREWVVEFDSLEVGEVMSQNMMLNNNGQIIQDNHTSEGGNSAYNIHTGVDFFSAVINKTYANHLPLVLQIDKDNNSPDQFAIVRMGKNYEITQKSPNLYNIKVTFIEQV